jgi:hypothetical protein
MASRLPDEITLVEIVVAAVMSPSLLRPPGVMQETTRK